MRTVTIECVECDHEIDCEVIRDEHGQFTDIPEACPSCGEDPCPDVGPIDHREDFHSDG